MGKNIGLDVGIKEFYTDSNGHTEPNPKFYRTGEKRLKFRQRRVSRKNIGSANRKKAINRLGRVHLKISGALTRTLAYRLASLTRLAT
jgi:putative transposase